MHSIGERIYDTEKEVQLIGNKLDIKQQGDAVNELERSEFYLREGERLTHMGSWSLRPDGIFDYWSPETFVLFGFDTSEGIPTLPKWLTVLHPDDRDHVHALLRKMFSEGVNCDVQYRVRHPKYGQRTMH